MSLRNRHLVAKWGLCMRRRQGLAGWVAIASIAVSLSVLSSVAAKAEGAATQDTLGGVEEAGEYVVLYAEDRSAEAFATLRALHVTVVSENAALGVALVRSGDPNFATEARQQATLQGIARNRPVAHAPKEVRKADPAEDLTEADLDLDKIAPRPAVLSDDFLLGPAGVAVAAPRTEPLADRQWNMAMIGVGAGRSYATQLGNRAVRVGVIDTGIDGSHPDISANFDRAASRNFTTDIPSIDGPCEEEADHSCTDAADVDEDGHGTHVAGIIGAALDGRGMAGVAPNVTLVNLRAGQDSGYFFLKPVLDALTYAADTGIDVVNMSFFIDPWLFNCTANGSDSAAEQFEQRSIVAATQRALDYAHRRGVTLIAALGNEHTDLGNPTQDVISPDFPVGSARVRTVDNSCLSVPAELGHVISVSSVGPSRKKADYSNFGSEQTDISAPGGYINDVLRAGGTRVDNLILAPYPESVGRATGRIDAAGNSTTGFVIKSCTDGVCGYYQYLQGTSMAAPHVAGVAALIVSEFGTRDPRYGGLTMRPARVERALLDFAVPTACPAPVISYAAEGRPASYDAPCVGNATHNSIYGYGILSWRPPA